MPLSCGSGDPSGEEISEGFVLLWRNVVWGLVGFNRALLTLPFFSYCGVELGGFGRESTRGKLLLYGRRAVQCWAGVSGTCRSVLRLSKGSARATLQPAQGKSQTTQILQDHIPRLQFASLFALKSIQGGVLLSQAPLVPACRHCCLHKCTRRAVEQTDAIPRQW